MGSSPSAFLAYGYDLGGETWKFSEIDKYGLIDPAKVTWYEDSEDADDFITQAKRRLLAVVAGFTETWETRTDDDFFKRKREAEARLGVEFKSYSYREYPMRVLAAKAIEVGDGKALKVDPKDLAPHLGELLAWETALSRALDALEITPEQENASWLLCAYYS